MWPAVVLSLVLAADEPRWVPVGNAAGVHWYTRAGPGSEVNEIKVTALLDATPDEAWAVLADIEGWVETMPSTAAAEVLQRDEAGRALVYLRYVLPLISPRDTLIELTAQQGAQAWVIAWRAAAPERDVERPVAPGTVRLRVNEGEWRLEPREGGAKTFLIYRLLSAPGGSVPPFFVNRVNTLGVPQTIDSLRKAIVARRKR